MFSTTLKFTLILFGVLILVGLAALIQYHRVESTYYYNARLKVTKLHFDHLSAQLNKYKKVHGQFPELLSALIAWCECKEPTDSWGRPYIYERTDDDYKLYTLGEDGAVGGNDLDHDFSRHTNWDEHLK